MAGKADDPGRWFIEQAARADDLADLAELLRHLRRRQARREREAPLTYRELAGRTGWAPATISMYFTGRILPGTDRLDLMAALLGASPLEQGALATARDRVEDSRRRRPGAPREPGAAPVGEPPSMAQTVAAVERAGREFAVCAWRLAGALAGRMARAAAHRVRAGRPGNGAWPAATPRPVAPGTGASVRDTAAHRVVPGPGG